MNLFLDSDFLLNFFTTREPFLHEVKMIIHMGLNKDLELYTSSLIAAKVYYVYNQVLQF